MIPDTNNQGRAFSVPKNAAFSSNVWNAPCCVGRIVSCHYIEDSKQIKKRTPNLDEVSMNLSCTFSKSRRDVWTISDLRIVTTRFLVPGIEPLSIRKSLLTIP
jgi:hypothetical protein